MRDSSTHHDPSVAGAATMTDAENWRTVLGVREFITRGNVVDLAVAVVIGAAFTALVDAFTRRSSNPDHRFWCWAAG